MKTCKLIFICIAWILAIPCLGQYSKSGPIYLDGQSNMTISGKEFNSGSGDASILLKNCKNIKIVNCRFINIPTYVGVQLQNCSNIEVTDCYFDTFKGGVYAVHSTSIDVHCNSFKTIKGPRPRGQIVQFNAVSGSGNRINYNILEHVLGTGDPEDLINAYASSGTSSDPLQIIGNKLRGGGPSTSGGGIMVGDNGGHDIIVADNILVDPGQYGIGAPAGYNITIKNNKVYAKQQSFTNVGIYVGLASEIAAGFPCTGSTIRVENNQVNWTNKNGIKNGWYNCSCCSGIIQSGNNFNAPISSSILPTTLSLDATKCSSSTPVNQPPSITFTSPANHTSFTAPADLYVKVNASDVDGTISEVNLYINEIFVRKEGLLPYEWGAADQNDPSIKGLAAGTYILKAVAVDNEGSTSSSQITITVNNPITVNKNPVLTILSPANGVNFTAPATVTISADASDPDGSVSKVEFFNGASLLGSDATSPYSYSWTNVAAGSYTITAKATDNKGATVSKTVNITVNPVVSGGIGVNGSSCITAGGTYSYSVNPDPSSTTFQWWSNSGATITQSTTDPKKISIYIPEYMNGTSFTLTCGVNFSKSPWYKEYTKTIKVGGCTAKVSAVVNPQPTDDQATLSIDNGGTILSVIIFNSQGMGVFKETNIAADSYSLGANLAAGIYMVQIETTQGITVTPFIKW